MQEYSGYAHTVITHTLGATTTEIIQILAKKYLVSDTSKFNIFLSKNGNEIALHPDDKPIELQMEWLESIGYSAQHDNLEKLGLEDHSYFFRFVFREIAYFAKTGNPEEDVRYHGPLYSVWLWLLKHSCQFILGSI